MPYRAFLRFANFEGSTSGALVMNATAIIVDDANNIAAFGAPGGFTVPLYYSDDPTSRTRRGQSVASLLSPPNPTTTRTFTASGAATLGAGAASILIPNAPAGPVSKGGMFLAAC